MRLFIGIPLATTVTERLSALRNRLERHDDGLRWSDSESWHITLQFLGATSEAQYACVVEHLQQISTPVFPIRLQGLGFFDRAGVFYADVPVSPQLTRVQQMVTQATAPCGFVPEDRPYHPHITLARKKGQSAGGIRDLKRRFETERSSATGFPAFTASEFLLYESFLGPSGSRYEVRARFPLASTSRL
jgi:2'-5' RNA ligase